MASAQSDAGAATEIVYVCSPSWQSQLFISLDSLLRSGSRFDRVAIYCVGSRPDAWQFRDPRIAVIEVPPRAEEQLLEEGRFFVNKTYLCGSTADRVVYLDADTIVQQPIDSIWAQCSADVLARPTTRSLEPTWNRALWTDVLRSIGASEQQPYLNGGFVIFQNGVHRPLSATWLELIRALCERRSLLEQLHGPGTRMAEQLALSLSLGAARRSHQEMSEREHGFGWLRESWESAVVLHTGGILFDHFAGRLGLSADAARQRLISPNS
jgi:hypothetical protein